MSDEILMFIVIFGPIATFAVLFLLLMRKVISKRFSQLTELLNSQSPNKAFVADLPTLIGTPKIHGTLKEVDIQISLQMQGHKKRKWFVVVDYAKDKKTHSFQLSQWSILFSAEGVYQKIIDQLNTFE